RSRGCGSANSTRTGRGRAFMSPRPVLAGSGGLLVLAGSGGLLVLAGSGGLLVLAGSGGLQAPHRLSDRAPARPQLAARPADLVAARGAAAGCRRRPGTGAGGCTSRRAGSAWAG